LIVFLNEGVNWHNISITLIFPWAGDLSVIADGDNPSHSPDAVIIQNTKVAMAEVGACQRVGLARQMPLMPITPKILNERNRLLTEVTVPKRFLM
jgi:hypothetical protein